MKTYLCVKHSGKLIDIMYVLSDCSQPLERRQAHVDGVRDIKWCKCNPSLLATSGRPGRQIKVFSTKHYQVRNVRPGFCSLYVYKHQDVFI